MDAVRANRRPSQIITRKSIENTIASVAASGGSTNAVLHLLAIAREMGIPLTIDDFDAISKRTPFICDAHSCRQICCVGLSGRRRFAPAREAPDRRRPRRRLDADHQRQARWLKKPRSPKRLRARMVIHTFENPIKPNGGLVILKGNLAPEGCVMKIAAANRVEHRGPARVFECEEDCFAAVQAGQIKPGDVLVIRYEGPKGGPGMREMLQVTAAVSSNRGAERDRGAAHRRPLQRRDARIHCRPRGS